VKLIGGFEIEAIKLEYMKLLKLLEVFIEFEIEH